MADSRKTPPELLAALLNDWPDALSGQCRLEVGLSGGLDSMVLLDLLARARTELGFSLTAVHVHHGLSPCADSWAEHCARECAVRGVPLRIERVRVSVGGGESLEAVARRERYRVYHASGADAVVLAHHQDDLAETVLLQLLRGAGPRGLAAMPAWRWLGPLGLWRPLLAWRRETLCGYATQHALAWVEDESNADTRWRRNLLRHRVLPALADAMPHYRAHLARAASLAADAADILREVAQADLDQCLVQGRLSVAEFLHLSPPRQRQLLARWCEQLAWGRPAPGALEQFCRQLAQASAQAAPVLALPGGELLRYRAEVWALRAAPATPAFDPLPPLLPGGEYVQPGGILGIRQVEQGLPLALLQDGGLELRVRAGGERLAQAVGRKPVKTLLQEAGLPPRLRPGWPLLYHGAELLAVPGIAVSAQCVASPGWWPHWQPQSTVAA